MGVREGSGAAARLLLGMVVAAALSGAGLAWPSQARAEQGPCPPGPSGEYIARDLGTGLCPGQQPAPSPSRGGDDWGRPQPDRGSGPCPPGPHGEYIARDIGTGLCGGGSDQRRVTPPERYPDPPPDRAPASGPCPPGANGEYIARDIGTGLCGSGGAGRGQRQPRPQPGAPPAPEPASGPCPPGPNGEYIARDIGTGLCGDGGVRRAPAPQPAPAPPPAPAPRPNPPPRPAPQPTPAPSPAPQPAAAIAGIWAIAVPMSDTGLGHLIIGGDGRYLWRSPEGDVSPVGRLQMLPPGGRFIARLERNGRSYLMALTQGSMELWTDTADPIVSYWGVRVPRLPQ